ncbi:unnamed protein product, partial [Iphiclides podalirius]
ANRPRAADEALNKSSMSATRRHRLMKLNAATVLECSTATPFKWHRQNFLCFYCHRAFKDTASLKEHTKAEHPEPRIKSAVSYLRRDERVKIDVSSMTCSICDVSLDGLGALIAHLESAHRKSFAGLDYGVVPYALRSDRFHCAVCDAEFQYFIKLNQHMNTHYGNYVCELCGKPFLSRERLRCHAAGHGPIHRCGCCAETFSSPAQRTSHERRAHGRRRVKCLHCSETFASYGARKSHHSTAHGADLPTIHCPVCRKSFPIASKMRAHLKEVHLREKNFACPMCDQRFFSRSHVQKHMVRHVGERVHQCDVCRKSYARKQTLRDHMRIHNGDRRFACELCGQAFVQNNSLRLHMRVHHPDAGGQPKGPKTQDEGH